IGTAAKVVPASLAASAAGSALVLSGTASAATAAPAGLVRSGIADLAGVKTTAAASTWVTQGRHAAPRSVYTVVSGNPLSGISARFCGPPADYPNLAAASGISNPDVIYVGEDIKLKCHHAVPQPPAPRANDDAAPAPPHSSGSSASAQAPQQPQT